MQTTLSERGQVVIPKPIRDMFNLQKGVVFDVFVKNDKIILKPKAKKRTISTWKELRGLIKGKYSSKQFLQEREEDKRLEDI